MAHVKYYDKQIQGQISEPSSSSPRAFFDVCFPTYTYSCGVCVRGLHPYPCCLTTKKTQDFEVDTYDPIVLMKMRQFSATIHEDQLIVQLLLRRMNCHFLEGRTFGYFLSCR